MQILRWATCFSVGRKKEGCSDRVREVPTDLPATGIGTPVTWVQIVFTITIVLIGSVAIAFIIGSVTDIVSTIDLLELETKKRLNSAFLYLKKVDADEELTADVINFLIYKSHRSFTTINQQLSAELSDALAARLQLHVKQQFIHDFAKFFGSTLESDLDELMQVIKCLNDRYCGAHEIIFYENECVTEESEMFFLMEGRVQISSVDFFTKQVARTNRRRGGNLKTATTAHGGGTGNQQEYHVDPEESSAPVRTHTWDGDPFLEPEWILMLEAGDIFGEAAVCLDQGSWPWCVLSNPRVKSES